MCHATCIMHTHHAKCILHMGHGPVAQKALVERPRAEWNAPGPDSRTEPNSLVRVVTRCDYPPFDRCAGKISTHLPEVKPKQKGTMHIYHKPSARDKRAYKEAEQEALTSGTASGFTDCKPPTGPEKHRKGRFHIDVESSRQRYQNQSHE